MKIEFIENLKKCLLQGEPCDGYPANIEEWLERAFIMTYNELPFVCLPSQYADPDNPIDVDEYILMEDDDYELNPFKSIDPKKSCDNIVKQYPDTIRIKISPIREILYNEKFIITPQGRIFLHTSKIEKELLDCFEEEQITPEPKVYLVTKGNYGFEKNKFKVNSKSIDGNYNDDLPLEKLQHIIRTKDESGIILLSSVAGCGKSYLIRHLIETNREIQFLYIDSSVFNYINDSSFVQFLLKNKDSMIILEDCEMLLKSRDTDYNNLLSTLLNISDGILGDSLNLKFICTFNTNLTNIDKALLRKGRLKLKYELKELTKNKVEGIFEKLGIDKSYAKPMTLAEAYNFEEDNGVKEKKKIGF